MPTITPPMRFITSTCILLRSNLCFI